MKDSASTQTIIQEKHRQGDCPTTSGEVTPAVSDSINVSDQSVNVPLVVDLDGTLLRTDLLHESIVSLFKKKPWKLLAIFFRSIRGRKYAKRRIFAEARLDPAVLPIHTELVAMLRAEKDKGRRLVLATASDQGMAAKAVEPLGLFDLVIGSTGNRDLQGAEKLATIEQHCGNGFDYAGSSSADHVILTSCRQAILVNADRSVEAKAQRSGNVTRIISSPRDNVTTTLRSMRIYQWVKNLLIFVPAFTSHEGVRWPIVSECALAFVAFSLCASATYITNDLLDLEEDRRDPAKRSRPLAAGECSIRRAAIVASVCMLAGLGIAFAAGNRLLPIVLLYVVLTACYSLYVKKVFLLDVLALAALYTLRVIAGHIVTGIAFSMWLLSFCFLLFLSLAFSKRAAELIRVKQSKKEAVLGRGYVLVDLQVVTIAGICSGFLSSLVLALYINSESVVLLYRRPAILWGIFPLLLYYIVRVWIICGRGGLDEDPIVYTAKSKSTYIIAALVCILVIAATIRL
jgi:4-hydroxybenzoate polyprenyltransferase/phosphoserine phosphatase